MKKSVSGLYIIFILSLLLLTGCVDKAEQVSPQNITGYVQKGPFISGSSVTAYDLNEDLTPTGKAFIAQITDNIGSFELKDVLLSSSHVSLRADGFYFNEVLGTQSVSQITLFALTNISDTNSININILTHLEKARIEYLMENGNTFSASKMQAQEEILAVFNIEKSDIKLSEKLNISEGGEDNGILLAVSAILQGYRSESELTSLLSDISNDIREDGTLDSEVTGSALINHAVNLDTTSIRNNLTNRYDAISETSDIQNYEKYIRTFIDNSEFIITESLIDYPQTGAYGPNILYKTATDCISGTSALNSFAAKIPVNGALKIMISSLSSDTIYFPATDSTAASVIITPNIWLYSQINKVNWNVSTFDVNTNTQIFTVAMDGENSDLRIYFDKGSFLISYYEMNSVLPNYSKTIYAR